MSISSSFKWQFHRIGGLDQVVLRSAEELRNLGNLDPKLWVALSCPAFGLEFDARTLELMDGDRDGRIRVPEVLTAVEWVCSLLEDPSILAEPGQALPLAAISRETEEGKRLAAAGRAILDAQGKPDAEDLHFDDLAQAIAGAAQHIFNGDGVIPPLEALEPDVRAFVQDAISTVGGVNDVSGKYGVNRAVAEAFLRMLGEWREWKESVSKACAPLGNDSQEAWELMLRLAPKIDDYFLRTELADFVPQSTEALNPDDAAIAPTESGLLDLSALAGLPLARVRSGMPLTQSSGLNPAWKEPLLRFFSLFAPLLEQPGSMTREDWRRAQQAFAAYGEAQGKKPLAPAIPVDIAPVAALETLGPVNTNCKNVYIGLQLTHEDFQRTIRAHCG